MFKNVASQKVIVFAFDATTNLPKTGDAANLTAYVSKDYGTVTILTDTSATEMDATNAKGYYLFDLSQAETNADTLLFSCKSATANISVIASPATVFTKPPNFTALSVDSNGRLDIIKVAGTTQTAGDIPAMITTVDDFVDTEVAAIKAKTDLIPASPAAVGDIPTAAVIADAVWDEDATGHQTQGTFGQAIGDPAADATTIYQSVVTDATGTNVAADIIAMKVDTAAILVDTAEIGVAGAGLTAINLPDQTMNITGDITGNLSGSVGSVTGLTASNLDATISSRASQTSLDTLDDYVDTEVGAIKTQTDKLTFTVANEINANARYINGSATAAANLALSAASMKPGTAITGTLTTTQMTTDLTSSVDDVYKKRVIVFTGGGISGEARTITAYNGTTKLITVNPAFTAAPANTDPFIIV